MKDQLYKFVPITQEIVDGLNREKKHLLLSTNGVENYCSVDFIKGVSDTGIKILLPIESHEVSDVIQQLNDLKVKSIGEKTRTGDYRIGITKAIEIFEDWMCSQMTAKSDAVEFLQYVLRGAYKKSRDGWSEYDKKEITAKTDEELYSLFLKQKDK